MYDSVIYNVKLAEKRSKILEKLHLKLKEPNKPNELYEPKSYALATVHRAENTDDPEKLKSIFKAFQKIAEDGLPVVVPLHPRTQKSISQNFSNSELSTLNSKIMIIDPVSYLDMLLLEKKAQIILTDSGGVQKEAFFFQVPCVTLREEIEWVETVEAGWNTLVGCDRNRILQAARAACSSAPPFGDGRAAERIVSIVRG